MVRYFTSNVTYCTYVNCDIKIITHRDNAIRNANVTKIVSLKSYIYKNTNCNNRIAVNFWVKQ